MSLINENLHCARARPQRSSGTKGPLSRASPLCQGGCTSILWRVKIYYSEVKRRSSVASLRFIRGKKVPSLCFLWLEISRESCRRQNTQCWCYTASFQCSVMHPNQNLHLWLVNHWRRSSRVCVCRQTGKRIHSSLFKPGKKNGVYIRLYVCVHGWKLWQLTVYLWTFVWGVLFLEDKSTL